MYSVSQDIENSGFNGWLNSSDILLKNNRRQIRSRKRRYDLANIGFSDNCEDIRRVLRPRHNPGLDICQDATRTRPIRTNRVQQRQIDQTIQQTTDIRSEPQNLPPTTSISETALSQSNSNLSLLQALATYNWSHNYLLQTDPSFLQRIQQVTYPNLSNMNHVNQRIPQFDPWVLHNYLLTASFNGAGTSQLAPDITNDERVLRMSQVAFTRMAPEMSRSNSLLWQYPIFLNSPINSLQNQSNRPSHELNIQQAGSTHMDPNSDLLYYLRFIDYSQRNSVPTLSDDQFQGMYSNEHLLSTYCNHMFSNPFTFGSICPYHTPSHLLNNTDQTLSNIAEPISSTQSEPATSQSQTSLNSFLHAPGMTFDQFWPHMTSTMRPLNYSLNGTNIDTLLHLAAHFEQRKRGITREELDKLPTYRYKATTNKQKQKDKNSISDSKTNLLENILKCLVCLEDFEPKQNIRVLRCNHEFHAKCIDKWLKINRTCPLCRADAFDGSAQKDMV